MRRVCEFSLVMVLLCLLVACGSDVKDSERKADKSVSASEKFQDIHLQGTITGDVNGEAFTYFNETERPGKIRTTSSGKSLNLTFSTLPIVILTVNVHAYHGADVYADGSHFKLIEYSNVKGSYKNSSDSKIAITEDSETHLKGTISFKTTSDKEKEFVINATFNLNKAVIDLNDRDALLAEIKETPSVIESLGELKADKDFILKAIAQNQIAFNYADESLQGDESFILKAMRENPKSIFFMYVQEEMKSDENFALKAIEINFTVFHLLDKKLKNDKEFALRALRVNPKIVNFLSRDLKQDQDIVAASEVK